MENGLIESLGLFDCAVLQQSKKGHFCLINQVNDWIKQLVPDVATDREFYLPGCSAFLDDFIIDAEEFWHSHQSGSLKSGIWSEDFNNTALHLEAVATIANNECYLVVKNVAEEHQRQQQTLQVARELLIANDRIVEKHDYINERLRCVLLRNANNDNVFTPLHEAIRFVNTGVIITDANDHLLEANPAVFKLFDLTADISDQTPLTLLQDLLKKQYPAPLRQFSQQNPWCGEIYWYSAPNQHKWLQLDVNCVADEEGAIAHRIYTLSDITRVKYLLQSNEDLALIDALTGLPNRQHYWQLLTHKTKASLPFYTLYVDIKNFKHANELCGHVLGDQLLVDFKNRLQGIIGLNDTLCRIGADEFAVIHVPTSKASALDFKSFLDETITLSKEITNSCEQAFDVSQGKVCDLSVNIGVAQFPTDASTAEDLVRCNDLALSSAKQDINENIQFYSNELKVASLMRLKLVDALRTAIEKHQFELYLQPIYDLHDNRIIKAEALLRWHISLDEIISPDVFIPLAEENGLIISIGRWVIDRACKLVSDLEKHAIRIPITLNVSPKQVADHTLVDFITHAVQRNEIDPRLLEIEITEGVLVDNHAKARQFLQDVRQMGISISIDDFGTGYSSLSYLKYLPIDHLKIDRSFIMDLDDSEDDQAIVLAVIAMAQRLKLGVIAEGLETESQRRFLENANCYIAQGFLLSEPLPIGEFITHVKQSIAPN